MAAEPNGARGRPALLTLLCLGSLVGCRAPRPMPDPGPAHPASPQAIQAPARERPLVLEDLPPFPEAPPARMEMPGHGMPERDMPEGSMPHGDRPGGVMPGGVMPSMGGQDGEERR